MRCLIEIGGLTIGEYDTQFAQILAMSIECLTRFLPPETSTTLLTRSFSLSLSLLLSHSLS